MVEAVKAAKDAGADALLREHKQHRALNGALGAKTRAMHEQHRAQWTTLSKDYANRKAQVYETAKTAIDRSRASIAEQYRPTWRDLHRKQWREHKDFEAREQSTSGKIANTLQALSNRSLVDPDKKRGLLSSALNFAVSKEARADVLAKAHAQEKARLKAEERKALDAAVSKIKADRSTLISKERKSYAAKREALILGQEADRKAMQLAWRDRKADMARAFDTLKRSATATPTTGSEITASELLASLRLRKAFQEAGDGTNSSRRPRVRGRDDHER